MAELQEKTTTRGRRRPALRNSGGKPSSGARRGRGVRQPTESVLADLDQMVSALIQENRELHRQIDKLSRQAAGATSGPAERVLRSIQRRISGAVDSGRTTRRRQSAPTTPMSKTPRKITDPEVLERRRQALAKARAARGSEAGKRLNRKSAPIADSRGSSSSRPAPRQPGKRLHRPRLPPQARWVSWPGLDHFGRRERVPEPDP